MVASKSESANPDPSSDDNVVEFRGPTAQAAYTARVGMWVFMITWGVHFGALLVMYACARWILPSAKTTPMPDLPVVVPVGSVAVAALSSFFLDRGFRALQAGHEDGFKRGLTRTLVAATVFIISQGVLYQALMDSDIAFGRSAQMSLFWAVHWVHIAHVVVGIGALALIAIRARTSFYTPARSLAVRLWSQYWHFVGVVWGAIVVLLYSQ